MRVHYQITLELEVAGENAMHAFDGFLKEGIQAAAVKADVIIAKRSTGSSEHEIQSSLILLRDRGEKVIIGIKN